MAPRSYKYSLRTIPWALLSVAGLLAGCASKDQNVVRADYARRFSCSEAEVYVTDLGPRTARASGCGRSSLLYSCEQSRASTPSLPPQTPPIEGEVQAPNQSAGVCTWVPVD